MKTVIFTGSGFSKAIFDQKIQRELLDDFLSAPESRLYIEYLPEDLISLVRTIDDIELIMSHYLNLGYSGLPHKSRRSPPHQRAIIFFRMALAIYFRDKFLNSGYKYYEQETKNLIQDFFSSGFITSDELTLVTTNYDLGLERVIEDLYGQNSYYYPGFEDRPQVEVAIPILKLHGSINWLEDRGSIDNSGFKNSSRQSIKKDVLNELTIHPLSSPHEFTLQSKGKKYTPIMVPFFRQKSMWYEINKHWWGDNFDELWKICYEYISGADQILFWGYSLPTADYHMFSFLFDAMTGINASCEVVDLATNGESNLMKMIKLIYKDHPEDIKFYKEGLQDYLEYYFET